MNDGLLEEFFLFDDLPDSLCQKEPIVMEPLVRVVVRDSAFFLDVYSISKKFGEETIWQSLSVKHGWVFCGDRVRALPAHHLEELKARYAVDLDSPLTSKEVLSVLRHVDGVFHEDKLHKLLTEQERDLSLSNLSIEKLNASLFKYQEMGVAFIDKVSKRDGGLILADEMGLGKTIQIIAAILCDEPSPNRPALIVCPASLIANWVREFQKFAPHVSMFVHNGSSRPGVFSSLLCAQVVIVTYDTLVVDQFLFQSGPWHYLICDEAQAVKNPESRRRSVIAGIDADKRILVTGTPIETSLMDLWSLADIAQPGILGSLDDFKTDFPDSESSAAELNQLAKLFILRRRVSEVADELPSKTSVPIPISMPEEQAVVYNQILEDTVSEYGMAGGLVSTIRLQMFCAHPALTSHLVTVDEPDEVPLDSTSRYVPSAKIDLTLSLIEEAYLSARKVLVFCIFNRVGDLVKDRLMTLFGDSYWGVINGSTPAEDRQDIVDEFSAHHGNACLFLNPKAAGAGLNIVAATVVIHISPVWNPALEMQASARAHRRGQEMPVTVYKLFYENTVEQVMLERSEWREALGYDVVDLGRDVNDLAKALQIRPGDKDGQV
ncbi:DEAD/DEAH box helicase [Litorivicinus sp.]|nr:DEAD/DEAH box helicase [Litorivicinus sp.]